MRLNPTCEEIIKFVLQDAGDPGTPVDAAVRERVLQWTLPHTAHVVDAATGLLRFPPQLNEAEERLWYARYPLLLAGWSRFHSALLCRYMAPLLAKPECRTLVLQACLQGDITMGAAWLREPLRDAVRQAASWPEVDAVRLVQVITLLPPRQARGLLRDLREYLPAAPTAARDELVLALDTGGLSRIEGSHIAPLKKWQQWSCGIAPWLVLGVNLTVAEYFRGSPLGGVMVSTLGILCFVGLQLLLGLAAPWWARLFHLKANWRDAARCYALGVVSILLAPVVLFVAWFLFLLASLLFRY